MFISHHFFTGIMSQQYNQWFDRQYLAGGFRILYDSWQGHTAKVLEGSATGSHLLNLPVNGKRVKAFTWTLRNQLCKSSASAWHHAFTSEGIDSYQLMVDGLHYPPTPLATAARMHNECLKGKL